MTMPNEVDLERVDLLDRLICHECAAISRAMFTAGNYHCTHSRVFMSVSKPAQHRKVSMLIDVSAEDLGLAILDCYGEEALRAILRTNAHFVA